MDTQPKREGYDVAQICENGHVITTRFRTSPDAGRPFCGDCGKPTLTACRNCGVDLPGMDWVQDSFGRPYGYRRKDFCQECGAPHPWIEASKRAFEELLEMAENLSEEDRGQLSAAFDDLVSDTPRTQGAAVRLKRFLPNVGKEVGQGLRTILTGVATELAKEQLGLK